MNETKKMDKEKKWEKSIEMDNRQIVDGEGTYADWHCLTYRIIQNDNLKFEVEVFYQHQTNAHYNEETTTLYDEEYDTFEQAVSEADGNIRNKCDEDGYSLQED